MHASHALRRSEGPVNSCQRYASLTVRLARSRIRLLKSQCKPFSTIVAVSSPHHARVWSAEACSA